jgi:hypothetical protein
VGADLRPICTHSHPLFYFEQETSVRDLATILKTNREAQRRHDGSAPQPTAHHERLARKLARDFQILDALLTGNDPLSGRGGREIPECCEQLARDGVTSELYYLSDGGYSRIGVREDGGLFLTDNSRQEVRERWSRDGAATVRFRLHVAIGKRQMQIEESDSCHAAT